MEMYYETRGEGEPLVLLHGGGGIGANWDPIFKELPKGYWLIVPDLRGHGRSTNPSLVFSFQQAALDVYAMLDLLGIERCKAIGMSLGAKTLLHMATQQPSRIEAMVLVCAAPYFPEQAREIMRNLSSENRSEAEWQQMRQWHKHGDDQIKALWRMGNAFKDNYTDMNLTPPYLGSINAHTLIVHGDRGSVVPGQPRNRNVRGNSSFLSVDHSEWRARTDLRRYSRVFRKDRAGISAWRMGKRVTDLLCHTQRQNRKR